MSTPSAPSTFTRFVRGLLLFSIGLIVGGTLVYLWLGSQPSSRGLAAPSSTPAAIDPAAPPVQPVGTMPRPEVSPEAPAGQFDYIPSARKPLDNASVAAGAAPVLDGRQLIIPVQGIQPKQLSDTFTDARGSGRVHDAIDIMAPTGTPVLATADGTVTKLFESKAGGTTLYQTDTSGNIIFYYAHLQGYAPGIVEGMQVQRGDVIGFVGSTGNASPDAPHLHFAIMLMDAERKWWKGSAINPYPLLSGHPSPAAPAVATPPAPAR